MLFAEEEDLAFDLDDFIFTTEAHLLPLKLSSTVRTVEQDSDDASNEDDLDIATPSQCPNVEIPWADVDIYAKLLNKQCSGSRFGYDLNDSIDR